MSATSDVVSDVALNMMKRRILFKRPDGKPEEPIDAYTRVGIHVAQGHEVYNKTNDLTPTQFRDKTIQLLSEGRFMPNTPTIVNSGYPKAQCSACFVLPVDDNLPSIYKAHHDQGLIQASGGGVGFYLGNIRSKGILAANRFVTKGPINWLKMYNEDATHVAQGMREGANMAILDVAHPDIVDFITCKKSGYNLTIETIMNTFGVDDVEAKRIKSIIGIEKFNISVSVSDRFMQAVSSGDEWYFIDPHTKTRMGSIQATELWDLIIQNAWENGEPGIFFEDEANRHNTIPHIGRIRATNPCLRKGSRLLTKNGWMKVEDLDGNEHLIFDGISFVKGKVWKSGNKKIIRVHINNGMTIDVTADHKLYTENGWVEAKDVEGLKIPYLFPNIQFDKSDQLRKCITGFSNKYYSHNYLDLMECLGFLQGDGSIYKDKVNIFYTPDKDSEFIDSTVLPILANIAGDKDEECIPSKMSDKNGYVISRVKLSNWLISGMGFDTKKLPERTLPEFIWNTSIKAQQSFLRGLYSANGNILNKSRTAVILVSACRNMLQEVQLLLQINGIFSAIRVHNKEKDIIWHNGEYTSKESYHLEITQQDSIYLFNRLIGFSQECQQNKLQNIVSINRVPINNASYYRTKLKVVKVEGLDLYDDVYDFECKTTHMGLVNGIITHNCGEQTMLPNESCNLGHANLGKFVIGMNGSSQIDWDGLEDVIKFGTQFLDNIVEINEFPIPELAHMNRSTRRIGLGVMGWADMLAKLGIPYDSDEALKKADEVGEFFNQISLDECQKLGQDRGNFPFFEGSVFESKYKHMRNSDRTTVAPTGQTSMYAGCNGSIEPLFSPVTVRNQAEMVQIDYHPIVFEILNDRGLDTPEIREKIGKLGSIRNADFLPEDIRAIFPSANEINYKWHVGHQAMWQKHITSAISKTINFPHSATVDDVKNAYEQAFESNCKGITIYRDGTRLYQPLSIPKENNLVQIGRSAVTHGSNRKIPTGCGNLMVYVGGEGDNLQDVTARLGKSGGCASALNEAIARMTSIALQHGASSELVIRQLSGIRCHLPAIYKSPNAPKDIRPRQITSCGDAISVAINEHIAERKDEDVVEHHDTNEHAGACPNCGGLIAHEEGCQKCHNCFWSRC